ncbi:ankyrin repeat domain-containing protein SOWAHC-like [Porites lutea]|uniref:ankyrin repeat domain-containing protein SOWAHC-like n=1 Tax=Porites lutea TaxID=51062 RepID=UPI003CC5CBA5
MSGNEGITLQSVREFLVKNNGKVKNIDLVHHFRQQLNDPANKSKVRGEFKEIVHTIATVQTIDGEKYFVLKKPKEAPAVLRKPPRPTKHKDRPVSLPPVFRGAKLEEVPQGNSAVFGRTYSEDSESPSLVHANKENRPVDRGDGRDGNNGSGDSGLESDSSSSVGSFTASEKSTIQMLQKKFLNADRGSSNGQPDNRVSKSNDDLDRMDEDMEGDDLLMGGPTAHLEPLEKEWFITAARGNRAQIMCLLEQDRNLATKKDFMLVGTLTCLCNSLTMYDLIKGRQMFYQNTKNY